MPCNPVLPINNWEGSFIPANTSKPVIRKNPEQAERNLGVANAANHSDRQRSQEKFRSRATGSKLAEQACENLKVTDDNYRSGNISISDLLEAQALFQPSNDNLTNSRCNYQIALSKYLQAIGKYE